MISYLFSFFIIIGIFYSFITGNTSNINNVIITSGMNALDLVINMIPLLCLWLGLMKIAENSGLLKKLAKYLSWVIHPIFPELKREGKSISYISTNIIMNMFGLGNAATPIGLKAMKEMSIENNNSDIASRSMITFLVINTASVTLIPTTVISIRAIYNSSNPSDILLATIIVTFLSLIIGLFLDRLFFKIWENFR